MNLFAIDLDPGMKYWSLKLSWVRIRVKKEDLVKSDLSRDQTRTGVKWGCPHSVFCSHSK